MAPMRQTLSFFAISLLFVCLTTQGFSHAEMQNEENKEIPNDLPLTDLPLYLKADQIIYSQDEDKTIAKGNVEIYHQDGYVLLADEVTYVPTTNQIEAKGNVRLYNDKNDIVFSENIQAATTFREGRIERPKLISADNRRVVALFGEKTGDITRMEKGVYTPCKSCGDGTKPPIWQVKAREIIHDEVEHDVIYKDAWIEFWGQPLFYLPYLSQPDPTVDRRTGFLGFKISTSRRLGTTITPSYYYVFSPSEDFTFKPIISSKENPVIQGIYRQRFNRADMQLEGSVTQADVIRGTSGNLRKKSSVTRWHSNSKAYIELSDYWRMNSRFYRASDPTYLTKYKFEDGNKFLPDNLQSDIIAEGFYDQNYVAIKSYAFQTTKEDVDQKTVPKIIPYVVYNYVGSPNEDLGSFFYGNAGLLNLSRQNGADVKRFTSKAGWQVPLYSRFGDVFTFKTQARMDLYNSSNFTPQGFSTPTDVTKGRFFPQVEAQWRRPLINETDFSIPFLISPVVSIVSGPVKSVDNKIPNEDSQGGIELDEASLFALDRFAGADRLDAGSRLNYGLVTELYPQNWRSVKFFIGQSYAFTRNHAIPDATGAGHGLSDIVGALEIEPSEYFRVRYRYLFNQKDTRARRSQVNFTVGYPMLQLSGDYLYAAQNATNTAFNGKEQIRGTLSSQLTKLWRGEINLTRDLGKNGGNLERGAGLVYEDECFQTTFKVAQTFFHNREIKPDTTVAIKFVLKTLGEFSTGDTLNKALGTNKKQ